MDKKNLGRALRLLRTFEDLGQGEAASRLGISASYLSELESGRKQPSFEVLRAYSRVFGVTEAQIMNFCVGGSDDSKHSIQQIALRILEVIASE